MSAYSTDLARTRSLSAFVAEYEAKAAALPEAIAAFEDAGRVLNHAASISGTYGQEKINTGGVYENQLALNLRRSAWLHVWAYLKMGDIASAKDKRQWEQSLADPAPFTPDNLLATFGPYMENPRAAILRGMAEVFTSLDPAYKSHEKVKIGVKGLPKRVVLYGFGGFIGNRYHSGGMDRARDIINALAAYQGKPLMSSAERSLLQEDGNALRDGGEHLDPSASIHEHRRLREAGLPPKTITVPARGVWLQTFKNGNGHLFFSPEALLDINRAMAEFYGEVLADCYDPDEARPAKRAGTDVARDLQYYPTPGAIVDRILNDLGDIRGKRVLEPSCGCGRFLDGLRAAGAEAIGCEVDPIRAAMCEAKGHRVMLMNFLETEPSPAFDLVVMNPPFYGKHYAKHVRHAMRFLKPGGRLVAILPATAQHDHGLLDDLRPDWCDLPLGAFRDSGTNICTVTATIRAPK